MQMQSVDEIINESSSFMFKFTLPAKIKKYNKANGIEINGWVDLAKKYHGVNPGIMHIIDEEDNIKNIEYILKDCNSNLEVTIAMKKNIELCIKKGECEETKGYYKMVKKTLLDKGFTLRDMDTIISGFKKTINSANAKIKKLQQEQAKK